MCLYFSFIFCFPGEFLRLVFKLSHLFFHYFHPVIQIVYWIFISKIKILTSKSLVGYYGYNILYPLCLSNDFNFSYSNILFFLLLISWSSWYQLIYLLSLVLTFIVLASLKYLMNLGESSYLYFWFPLAYRWKPASKCCWRGMEYMLGSVSQSLNSWLLEPVWEHQPHEALWFLFKQKPTLPMYCLPWQNSRRVGSWRHFSCQARLPLWTQKPLLSWGPGLRTGGLPYQPQPPLLQCFSADISCFCLISSAFCPSEIPASHTSLGNINKTPYFPLWLWGFLPRTLPLVYHFHRYGEKWVLNVCSDTLLIQSLAINSKLPTDYCPWNRHLS